MNQKQLSEYRVAFLSDIHGNLIALEAILNDIMKHGGTDQIWILGDLAASGPQPNQVLERLTKLHDLVIIRGNTDRYICNGGHPYPSQEEVLRNPKLVPALEEVAQSFAWTQGMVTAHGWLDFLDHLPLEKRVTLPDGTRLLAVHSSPGKDDGIGIHPGLENSMLITLLGQSDADLIVAGHIHWPMNVRVGATHIVNPGSVSLPKIPGKFATYAVLEASSKGYSFQHKRVSYDYDSVLKLLESTRHPGRSFIADVMRGMWVEETLSAWGEPR